ncbi:nucleotidyltransferase domain-containing protein [Candidatus Bathyarchaeota archaeon]|nr:nucleotidyltransferase domain-containing protein [Candidatus Bathyarchaeota archaeon]
MNDSGLNYTRVMFAVLDFMSRNPDRAYYVREVAEMAGVSTGAASITLTSLHGSRLIDLEEKGGLKLYKINLLNPVSRQFKVLFNVQRLEDLVNALSNVAERVVLFGSSAQGTDGEESDIDLFIETQSPSKVKAILRDFQEIVHKSSHRNLSPIIVQPGGLMTIQRKDQPLFENILRGRVLWPKE